MRLWFASVLMLVVAQTPSEVTRVVSGTVKVVGTGEPVAGAIVFASNDMVTTTDTKGAFTFAKVRPGTYNISLLGTPATAKYSLQCCRDLQITVTEKEDVSGIEFTMLRGGTISGRILDQKGQTIPSMAVETGRVEYSRDSRGILGPGGVTVTDDRGEYRISVPPGEYYVRTNPNSYRMNEPAGNRGSTYFPGTMEIGKAKRIRIDDGTEIAHVDIVNQVAELTVSGIISVKGRPDMAGLTMRAYLTPASGPLESAFLLKSLVFDRSTGKFKITAVAPGAYELMVISASPASQPPPGLSMQEAMDWDRTPNEVYIGRQTVNVLSDVHDLNLVLQPSTNTTARLVVAQGSPTVDLKPGRFGLVVRDGRLSANTELYRPFAGTRFDLTKEVVVRNMVESPYVPFIERFPNNVYIADLRQGSRSVFATGTVTGNGDPIEIVLDARGATIEGAVRAKTPSRIPYGTVVLVPEPSLRKNPILFKNTTVNTSGGFEFRGVAPGDYKLFAWEGSAVINDWLDEEFLAPYEDKGTPVHVGFSETAGGTVVTLIESR